MSRLDPEGARAHFPYKHEEVLNLVADNPPMGPDGPDDDRVRAEDFTSERIADAAKDYIEAQVAYVDDPGDATREAYEQAKRELVAARQEHRASRPAGPTVIGIRARRAGE